MAKLSWANCGITMRKRLLRSAAAFAGLVFVALLAMVMLRHSGVTRASFERLEEGMTKTEVLALMGRPPDAVEQSKWLADGFGNPIDAKPQVYLEWSRPDGAGGFVVFEDEKVSSWGWRGSDETSWETLKRWLRLP
jgi:hypothetical protein